MNFYTDSVTYGCAQPARVFRQAKKERDTIERHTRERHKRETQERLLEKERERPQGRADLIKSWLKLAWEISWCACPNMAHV